MPDRQGRPVWFRVLSGWTTVPIIEPEYMSVTPLDSRVETLYHGTLAANWRSILRSSIDPCRRRRGTVFCSAADPLFPYNRHESGLDVRPYDYRQADTFITFSRSQLAEAAGCEFFMTPAWAVLCQQKIPASCISVVRRRNKTVLYNRETDGGDGDDGDDEEDTKVPQTPAKSPPPRRSSPASSSRANIPMPTRPVPSPTVRAPGAIAKKAPPVFRPGQTTDCCACEESRCRQGCESTLWQTKDARWRHLGRIVYR